MAKRIGQVHKLGKNNRNQPGITTNLLTVPLSISFFHSTNDKKMDMALNSSSTNNMLSTDTDDVH